MSAVMQLAGYTAPEADDLRKAVAKKIPEKLHKHRQKFVRGAVKKDIPEQTAEAIFADWEEFARYGFNKAHAADYGVIAVQTAYLKCHYPVEYMTALLCANQNDTDKVAFYAADCRRMGISIEPPDINISGWDFTIEDCGDGKSSIRFGLGAVKNVGHGPVDAILKARGDGSFNDINDFVRRVDLRQVGKRALESLIRVGALDRFGPRPALLAIQDHILSISASHLRAADLGQMSLFGAHTGVLEEIHLPKVAGEISRREILNWERDLIGLYVSDHPLNPVMDKLTQTVTHFSGQLSDTSPQERVRVAGLVTRIRPHQTKTGKSMAFVTLEDVQGNIELVIFPRTWEQYAEMVDFDKILLVDGKIDAESGEPKVLVDQITTEFKTVTVVDSTPVWSPPSTPPAGEQENDADDFPEAISSTPPIKKGANNKRALQEVNSSEEIPPPPDLFPPGWEILEVVPDGFVLESKPPDEQPREGAEVSQEPGRDTENSTANEPPPIADNSTEPGVLLQEPALESGTPLILPTENAASEGVEAGVKDLFPVSSPPYIIPPLAATAGEDIHMITVLMRPGADKVRDNLRMRQAYGILISYPGIDRFALQIYERGRGYRIEFPNFTTKLCPELVTRLDALVGSENVRVEPLKIQ